VGVIAGAQAKGDGLSAESIADACRLPIVGLDESGFRDTQQLAAVGLPKQQTAGDAAGVGVSQVNDRSPSIEELSGLSAVIHDSHRSRIAAELSMGLSSAEMWIAEPACG
jgi:hypothetical protein